MRKKLVVILALAAVLTLLFSVSALAANTNTVVYYDEFGNQVTVNGMYYNSSGHPMYNANSFYTDANGNTVYVGGCRAYYYNASGNLVAGNYFYDANGRAVSRPTSYYGGWGCGWLYYDTQGVAVTGTFYYDDFGNLVEAPATTVPGNAVPVYRGCGCGCGWRWRWR